MWLNLHILMTEGPSDFFGFEILAKSDFLGSTKDAGIFLGREKKNREMFLGMLKKVVIFLGYKI